MKKILLFIFISASVFGQSVEITPTGEGLQSNAIIKKMGIGFEQRDTSGTIRVGTFVNNNSAFIQTHSNHPLSFATKNSATQMMLNTDGKFIIGIGFPDYWLDVKGRARIKHYSTSSPAVNETAGIWYNKANNTEGAFVGMYNDDIFGLFGMGTVSNWKFGFDLVNTKMGVGTMSPKHPLTFPNAIGDKISLWGGNISATDNHYGLGIQSAALQVYVPTTNENIVFGTGRSGAFSEKVRITGIGNVGIGMNNPTSSLEVARGAGGNGTAVMYGTNHASHFNYGTDEDTYIRGGKDDANVIINDVAGLGNVGIGTNNPTYKLHVKTAGEGIGIVHGNDGGIKIGTFINSIAGWFGTFSNHPMVLCVNNSFALGITASRQIQIGTTAIPSGYKMSVDGKIICTEITTLPTSSWPDYVFKPGYKLKTLPEVENFIHANGHLPNIPKAEDLESKGVALGNMSKLQMEKIEELTLYLIEMNKTLAETNKTLSETNKRLKKIEEENELLKKKSGL